jgi:hypothetical protein
MFTVVVARVRSGRTAQGLLLQMLF